MEFFGNTRTNVTRNHAFIAPDGHVQAPLAGWTNTMGIILISPRMGAKFSMYYALMEADASAAPPPEGVQRFVWVQAGEAEIEVGSYAEDEDTKALEQMSVGEEAISHYAMEGHPLTHESFAYIPAGCQHTLTSKTGCKLVIFEKRHVPLAGYEKPEFIVGHAGEVESNPFMGDDGAQLQLFLPDHPGYDMGVNLFTFAPGTPLPFVETHIMEHGMLMTKGGGVYRLDNSWYPIQAGDVLWMGPYCPQWFGALGKPESQYLYYKDVYRDPLLEG